MQGAAAFYRQRAKASYHRRRKYPLNSHDRQQCVTEARQFIRYYRAQIENAWQSRPAHEHIEATWLLSCEQFGVDPNERMDRKKVRCLPFPKATVHKGSFSRRTSPAIVS
jgi:hypothetical protein